MRYNIASGRPLNHIFPNAFHRACLVFLLTLSIGWSLSVGEHYQYDAYLGPFYVGNFSFDVVGTENIDEQSVFHVLFKSNIRQVDKESHIYLRASDYKPVKVIRYYFDRDYETEIYDQENKIGYVYQKDDFHVPIRVFHGQTALHTPMSLIFYLREQKLEDDQKFEVETTDGVLQLEVSKTRNEGQDVMRVDMNPMGLVIFYTLQTPALIPNVKYRLFFNDVDIHLKQ